MKPKLANLRVKLGQAWTLTKAAPWRVKLVVILTVLYLASPIDIIPDFIPVLGQLDDVIVIALAVRYLQKHLPEMLEVLDIKPNKNS